MSMNKLLSSQKVFLVDGRRTPFGRFGGSLMNVSPVDLAQKATEALLSSLISRVKMLIILFWAMLSLPLQTACMVGDTWL